MANDRKRQVQASVSRSSGSGEAALRASRPNFDEFLVLPFIATNADPYAFAWVNENKMQLDYGAILVRVSNTFSHIHS